MFCSRVYVSCKLFCSILPMKTQNVVSRFFLQDIVITQTRRAALLVSCASHHLRFPHTVGQWASSNPCFNACSDNIPEQSWTNTIGQFPCRAEAAFWWLIMRTPTQISLSAIVVDGANETAGCWMVDIQIRPEPMGECIVGKLGPKQRLVVILCSSMRTLLSLPDFFLTLTVSIPSTVFNSFHHSLKQISLKNI